MQLVKHVTQDYMTRYSGPGNIHSDVEVAKRTGLDAPIAQAGGYTYSVSGTFPTTPGNAATVQDVRRWNGGDSWTAVTSLPTGAGESRLQRPGMTIPGSLHKAPGRGTGRTPEQG